MADLQSCRPIKPNWRIKMSNNDGKDDSICHYDYTIHPTLNFADCDCTHMEINLNIYYDDREKIVLPFNKKLVDLVLWNFNREFILPNICDLNLVNLRIYNLIYPNIHIAGLSKLTSLDIVFSMSIDEFQCYCLPQLPVSLENLNIEANQTFYDEKEQKNTMGGLDNNYDMDFVNLINLVTLCVKLNIKAPPKHSSFRHINVRPPYAQLTHITLINVTNMPDFRNCKTLREIYFSRDNDHGYFSPNISSLNNAPTISKLTINKWRLKKIPNLSGHLNLSHLDLCHNKISNINPAHLPPNLTSLCVGDNNLKYINIHHKKIKNIDIEKNPIKYILNLPSYLQVYKGVDPNPDIYIDYIPWRAKCYHSTGSNAFHHARARDYMYKFLHYYDWRRLNKKGKCIRRRRLIKGPYYLSADIANYIYYNFIWYKPRAPTRS